MGTFPVQVKAWPRPQIIWSFPRGIPKSPCVSMRWNFGIQFGVQFQKPPFVTWQWCNMIWDQGPHMAPPELLGELAQTISDPWLNLREKTCVYPRETLRSKATCNLFLFCSWVATSTSLQFGFPLKSAWTWTITRSQLPPKQTHKQQGHFFDLRSYSFQMKVQNKTSRHWEAF